MAELTILGLGDMGPYFEPVSDYLRSVGPILVAADLRVAQCERVYTELGQRQLTGSPTTRLAPARASVFRDCHIDVASLAGNQIMDFGDDAMLDTKARLERSGIRVVGVGRNVAEARMPAIVECDGRRIAVLGYCSVLKKGYDATEHRAGVAPLRVRTFYEPMWDWEPGSPAIVHSVPYEEDLDALREDIARARRDADTVVLMIHWGVHYIPRVIASYQPTIARAALAAGADVIFGHHAHVPKAIAIHFGKVCFYSLGNFIMSQPPHSPQQIATLADLGVVMDPEYPHLAGWDGKRSLIARARVLDDGRVRVSFVPLLIDKELRPEVLRVGDERFTEAVEYMEWVSTDFDHRFTVGGDEVLVTGQ